MPKNSNISGCSTGYCTVSWSSRLTSSRPPTSSHDTLGTSTSPVSRSADGLVTSLACTRSSMITDMELSTSTSMVSASRSITSIFWRNALEGRLGAERGEVGADEAVRVLADALQVDLAVRLLAVGRDGVDLVHEDDGRRPGLGLGEHLAQVVLALAGHHGHDLRPVDDHEVGARLGRDGARQQRLAGAGRAV
ncbi:hypothetical protein CFC21_027584, partial [Triticum aestivum]